MTGGECGEYTETVAGVRTYTTGASDVFTQLNATAVALDCIGVTDMPPFDTLANKTAWEGNNSGANVFWVDGQPVDPGHHW